MKRSLVVITNRIVNLFKLMAVLGTKSIKVISRPRKWIKIVRHPEIITQLYRNILNEKALGGGERAIIYNWEKARNGKEFDWNWGQLAHINRYEWISPFVKGLRVLDVGCAGGSGTNYLALHGAAEAVGVDVSPEAIDWAKNNYQAKNLRFVNADALFLPFNNKSFDIIVSFDTIEHVSKKDQRKFISEAARIISSSGMVVIGTPNIEGDETAILGRDNPFHEHELNRREFEELVCEFFAYVSIKGEDMVVDGERLKVKWLNYLSNNEISIENIKIVDDDVEHTRGLIAVCKKPLI